MLRNTHHLCIQDDAKSITEHLSNNVAEFDGGSNLNTITFKFDPRAERLSCIVRIYGTYWYHDNDGYIDYQITAHRDNARFRRIHVLENKIQDISPFGITVKTVDGYICLSFTYLITPAGNVFDFVFKVGRSDYKTFSYVYKPISYERSRIELDPKNFMTIPQLGDIVTLTGQDITYIKDINNEPKVIVHCTADVLTKKYSIRLSKKYSVFTVFAGLNSGIINDTSDTAYVSSISFVIRDGYYRKDLPLYIPTVNLTVDSGSISGYPPIFNTTGYWQFTTSEMYMVYDGEDAEALYYHIDNRNGSHQSFGDNLIYITAGVKVPNNYLPVHSRSSEKKLQTNYTFNIISLPPSIYGGYNYGKCA